MLKLIGWVIKTSLFVVVILVLGNLIHWRGKTISDQIKDRITSAERMPIAKKAKNLASDYTPSYVSNYGREAQSTRLWTQPKTTSVRAIRPEEASAAHSTLQGPAPERIAPSERQKLRALIRELSGDRVSQVSGNNP